MFNKKSEEVTTSEAVAETPEIVEPEVVAGDALPAEEPVAEAEVTASGRGNEYGDSPQDPPIKAQGQQTVL